MPNGTWKTTADHRFDDLNREIARHLPDRDLLHVKDVAVSSGISTVEWCEALTAAGVRFEMTATDRFVDATLLETFGGLALLLHDGVPLQFEVRGYAFRPDMNWRSRVTCAVPRYLLRHPRLLEALTRRESDVELVSPRLKGIRVVEEDLLSPPAGQWDVIRAANVLNRGYFPDDTLAVMLRHLISSVRDGGLLAICRTDPESGNEASVFRIRGGRPEVVAELNGGSEVSGLACETVTT